jgi:5-methylcytosine-specific restriction enzyme A
MPLRAPSACKRSGCRGLVRDGVCSQCGDLRTARNVIHDQTRGTNTERGYDNRWRRVREMHLRSEPLCRMCLAAGRAVGATMVDHVVPIRDGGERLADINLQSLCADCHARKTADDLAARRESV